MSNVRLKFDEMVAALKSVTVLREEEIRLMLVAILAKHHYFALSEPGAGKSYLFDQLRLRLADDVVSFKRQITKGLTDAGITGPRDLVAMKDPDPALRESYITAGYLPTAHVAMLEEAFKGNTAALNALLTPTNERKFFNHGVEQDIPLWTTFFNSNEMPQQEHEELAALFDRIAIRRVVPEVVEKADILALLALDPPANPPVILNRADIETAQAEVRALPVSPAVREMLAEMGAELRGKKINLSGRKLRWAEEIIKANAWLAGADKAEVEHMDICAHMFWSRKEQIGEVETYVYGKVAPNQAEAIRLVSDLAALQELVTKVEATEAKSEERSIEGGRAMSAMQELAKRAVELEATTTGPAARRVADVIRRIDPINETIFKLTTPLTRNIPSAVDEARAELASARR